MSPRDYDCITYYDLMNKIQGFKMLQDRQESFFRKLGWTAYIAPHLDPKKMDKNPNQYWPTNGVKKKKKKTSISKKKQGFLDLMNEVNGKA